MTPDHNKYFPDNPVGGMPLREFLAVTEHVLYPVVFCPERHWDESTMWLFRVPSKPNGFAALPEVKFNDIREGDTLVMVGLKPDWLFQLRLLYVTKIDDGTYYVLMNDFLTFGQGLIDKFAGLLGRIPTE